jgi:glycosyltransferase involved in cell wall biosynthesis
MHLIVLENQLTTLRGGQELNLLDLCRGLVQRGHRITLLYLKPGNSLSHYQALCDRVIPISAYGFDWRSARSIWQFVPSLWQLWQIPTSEDSLVFCNDYHFSLFAYALSYCRKLPYVCYLQLPPCNLNRQRRFGLTGVDQFITVSYHTQQQWLDFALAPDRMTIVYNGVDAMRFKPSETLAAVRHPWGIAPETRVIAYVGRVDREKGLETLIQATAILTHQGTPVKTLIAGKPVIHHNAAGQECEVTGQNYQRSLMQLAETLGVSDRVEFVGYVSDPVSLYQASDVTVLPSVWNEAFGRSLIESLACGTPAIGARIGGIPEVLGDVFEDALFHPGDPQDLADRLAQILYWRDLHPDLGDHCRQYALTRFSSKAMMDGIEQSLYQTLKSVKKSPRSRLSDLLNATTP